MANRTSGRKSHGTYLHQEPGPRPSLPGYNQGMRWVKYVSAVVVLVLSAFATDQPQTTAVLPCGQGAAGAPNCEPSKRELKDAKAAYSRGIKLQKAKQSDKALEEFETAAKLAPKNLEYLTAREMTRQQLVFEHIQRGNRALLDRRQVDSMAEFRSALELDPENQFAQERLQDAATEWAPKTPAKPEVVATADELRLEPADALHEFHYRGDSRGLITQIAQAYGISPTLDDSVLSRRVRFDIDAVNFYTAMRAATEMTKTFWVPIDEKQMLVANDTQENHRTYDRMAMRTFRIGGLSAPTDLNDIVNSLRVLFEIRFIQQQLQSGTITIRAPQPVVDSATRFIEGLSDSRPQIMLDVHVYEISSTLMRNIGVHIPNQFELFNIPAGALAALGGQNIQDLINQLISGGGINQANSQSISALLAQLGNQQNSIFSQPLATFGGGLTFSGVSLGTASGQLSINESSARSLEHATLRVAQGNDANLHIGSRYPILNASFAPIFNNAAIAQNIQNNTFQSAFPSFNYEDIGLTLKAKPSVNRELFVSLQLEMQVRSLGAASLNGVPVISNREYKGSITLKNGEPAVIASSVSRTEQRSLNGIPGLGQVPVLNKITATNGKEVDTDELLVVITPHVVTAPADNQGGEVWMSQ